MKLLAHAKVNYTLEILGVRPDGYHALRSVVLPVMLADEITVEKADSFSLVCDAPGMPPPEKNLAMRAAQLLAQETNYTGGATISIVKHIPAGAGLGGGSSDAAAILRGLNDLWKLGLDTAQLAAIGAKIGSDVPALVWGVPVLMEGRGEIITPLNPKDYPAPENIVLYTPPIFSSTRAVYAEYRPEDSGLGPNDLQSAALRLYPEIKMALQKLEAQGLKGVRMSGSGSTVFGMLT